MKCAVLYLEAWLGERGYDVPELGQNIDYARRSVLREWLRDHGYDPDQRTGFREC